MRMMTRIVAATLFLATMGCGGSGLPKTVQLGGTVTLDGKPLSNANLGFHPADKDGAPSVYALVVNGKFLAEAVPQGKYRITVRSTVPPPDYGQPGGIIDSSVGAPKAGTPREPAKGAIPDKFAEPFDSVEATTDKLDLKFDLKSK